MAQQWSGSGDGGGDDAAFGAMDESAAAGAAALIDVILNGEYDGALWNGMHNELRRECRNMTSTAVQQNAASRFASNGGDQLERTRDYLQRVLVILCTRNIVQRMNALDDDDDDDDGDDVDDDTGNKNGDAATGSSAPALQEHDAVGAADDRPSQ